MSIQRVITKSLATLALAAVLAGGAVGLADADQSERVTHRAVRWEHIRVP